MFENYLASSNYCLANCCEMKICLSIFVDKFKKYIAFLLLANLTTKQRSKVMEKNKQPFSQRHPKWTLLIGFILLLIIIALVGGAVYLLIRLISLGVAKFVEWIATLSSTLDAVVVVALITGTVSIIGVIISSVFAKAIEYKQKRQEYLTQKREESYAGFVEMVYKLQKNGKNGFEYTQEEMLEDLFKFSKQITLWGSSKVVNKWVLFRENGTDPSKALDNIFLLEEIMNEMRKDLGQKKIKKGNLLAFFVNDIKQKMKSKK